MKRFIFLCLLLALMSCIREEDKMPEEWRIIDKKLHATEGTYVLDIELPKEYDPVKDDIFVDSVCLIPLYCERKLYKHEMMVYQVLLDSGAKRVRVKIRDQILITDLKPKDKSTGCWFVWVVKGKQGRYEIYSSPRPRTSYA